MNYKKGIKLIAEERHEQIEKHGRLVRHDVKFNFGRQLASGAKRLLEVYPDRLNPPSGWDENGWAKMCDKNYKDRCIIAGALIAAEIDRLTLSGEL